MPIVNFQASCATKWGDRLVVAGSSPELGNWSPTVSLGKLCTEEGSYPIWCGHVWFPVGTQVQFKFVILCESGELRWEESIENRELVVPTDDLVLQASFDTMGYTLSPEELPAREPAAARPSAELEPAHCRRACGVPGAFVELRSTEERIWPSLAFFAEAAAEIEAEFKFCPMDPKGTLRQHRGQQPVAIEEQTSWSAKASTSSGGSEALLWASHRSETEAAVGRVYSMSMSSQAAPSEEDSLASSVDELASSAQEKPHEGIVKPSDDEGEETMSTACSSSTHRRARTMRFWPLGVRMP
mmetsp:Transcript_106289/g.307651  ORF Transcript_106289/g.307651 Transcript_106289/m.307651 type:complete len:299 (-) Transcript_106289:221-1117(-)